MQGFLIIDEVKGNDLLLPDVDVFEIEWFETQKHKFQRKTKQGNLLHLQKLNNKNWQQADALYCNQKLIAQINIKPALTISFVSSKANEIADFCYYIGNRHLPIFVNEGASEYYVPYDGNLYEQVLSKFNDKISLSEKQLIASSLLKKNKKEF